MGININFSEVEERELIPNSVQEAICVSIEDKPSMSSEFNYLEWTFIIAGGQYDNKKLTMRTSLSPKALWRLQAILKGLGVSPEQLKSPDYDMDTDQYVGKRFKLTVTQRNNQGQLQNEIANVRFSSGAPASSGGAGKPGRKLR